MAAQTPKTGPAPDTTIPVPIPGLPIPVPIPLPHIGNPVQPIKDIGSFLTKLTDPNFYVRAAEFGAGMMLLAIGVFVIVKGPQRVESTTRVATKAVGYTPAGRAATVTRKATAAGKVAQHRSYAKEVGRAQGKVAARKISAARA